MVKLITNIRYRPYLGSPVYTMGDEFELQLALAKLELAAGRVKEVGYGQDESE